MRNINYTISNNLCTGCGVCGGACPSHAISTIVKQGRFLPQIDESKCRNDRGCYRCMEACPGVGIDLVRIAKEQFTDIDVKENKIIGKYLKCFIGHSNNEDTRYHCASGGMVSQFLIFLLEKKYIDGAVVTAFDPSNELLVNSYIATTADEILKAKSSKYSPVSLHKSVADIKAAPGSKYVVVGLPCHIHGFRKLMKIDKKLSSKITGLFSLFCSGSQTFNYTKYVLSQCGGNVDDLEYLAYRDGAPTGMVAKGKGFDFFKKYEAYNMPLKSTFYPRRCLLCVDMFGELADISFGDIHTDAKEAGTGINALIVRDRKWYDLLMKAYREDALHLSEITVERILQNRSMAYAKKGRNASFVEMLRILHKPFPVYDSKYDSKVSATTTLRYFIMCTKQFIGMHESLWGLLPKIK